MMAISSEDLTAKENMMLEEVRADYTKYTDLIIDNNYTGVIDEDHIEEIIRSLKVSHCDLALPLHERIHDWT